MPKANSITIKLGPKPWQLFIVPKNYTNRKYVREMSDAQIVLSFILIALHMPPGLSQRGQYEWLKDFVVTWTGHVTSPLRRALDDLSKTTLERYLHVAHDAELIFVREDGSEEPARVAAAFGQWLQLRLDDDDAVREMFPRSGGIDSLNINATWIEEAIGLPLPNPVVNNKMDVGEGAPRTEPIFAGNTSISLPQDASTAYTGGSGHSGHNVTMPSKVFTMDAPESLPEVQWYRDGVAIPGATSRTYVITEEDVGRDISAGRPIRTVPLKPITISVSGGPGKKQGWFGRMLSRLFG